MPALYWERSKSKYSRSLAIFECGFLLACFCYSCVRLLECALGLRIPTGAVSSVG